MQTPSKRQPWLRMLFVPIIGLMLLLGVITDVGTNGTTAPTAPTAIGQTDWNVPAPVATTPPVVTDAQLELVHARTVTYTVRSGDTLGKIANAHGTTWQAIHNANQDTVINPNRIREGQPLDIPVGDQSTTQNAAPSETVTTQPASAPSSRSYTRESFQAYALEQLGGNREQYNCLNVLWGERESGWNPHAENPSPDSSAYGIAQFLNGTWAQTGIAKTSDGYRQIDAGLIYIDQRYNTPCGAKAHSDRRGWY